MFRWLRRRQPEHPALAVLYWLAVAVATLVLLALLFFQIDRFLPAMF